MLDAEHVAAIMPWMEQREREHGSGSMLDMVLHVMDSPTLCAFMMMRVCMVLFAA